MKHTCLSFAAKRGLDPHIRKLLGYHLDHHEVTLATYSRDLLAEPLRQLKFLLTEIQLRQFIPDATRSGYLPELLPAQDKQQDSSTIEEPLSFFVPEVEPLSLASNSIDKASIDDKALEASTAPDTAFDDHNSSSTSSSGSSSSSISDEEVDIVPDFPRYWKQLLPSRGEISPVKHRHTHRLHLLVDAEHTELICGRALSQTYERLDRFPSHPLPTCVQCFARKLVGSFDEC